MSVEHNPIKPRGKQILHLATHKLTGENELINDKTQEVAAEAFKGHKEETYSHSLKRKQATVVIEANTSLSHQFTDKITRLTPDADSQLTEEQIDFVKRQFTKNLTGKDLNTIRALRDGIVESVKQFEPGSVDFKISQVQIKIIDSKITQKEMGEVSGWQNSSVRQFFEDNCLGVLDRDEAEKIISGWRTGSWLLRKETDGAYCFTKINESGKVKHLKIDHRTIAHVRDFTAHFPYSKQVTGVVHDLRNHGMLPMEDAEFLLEEKPAGTWMLYQAFENKSHPTVARVRRNGTITHRALKPREIALQKKSRRGSETLSKPFTRLKQKYGYVRGKFLAPAKIKQQQREKLTRAAERARNLYGNDDPRAKALGSGYRSEFVDQKHGYSLDLEPWWEHWIQNQGIKESFNEWMDKVRKGERPLGSELLSGARIEDVRHVKYLDERERQAFEVVVRDGKVYIKGQEEPLHCRKNESYIFVQSSDGTLYAGLYKQGKLNHSSFLSGRPVIACGEMTLDHGQVTSVSDKSGHYLTTSSMFCQGLTSLHEMGVDLNHIKLFRITQDGNYIRDYRRVGELIEENHEIQSFAENHFIPQLNYGDAQELLTGEAPGSWNMTYSESNRDYVVNIVMEGDDIESIFLSDIQQTNDTLITYFRQRRAHDLIMLDPYLGITEDLYEKLQSLIIKPFPLSVDKDLIEEMLLTKPEKTWLVCASAESGYVILRHARGRIYSLSLANKKIDSLRKLSRKDALSYGWFVQQELKQLSDWKKLRRLEVEPFPDSYTLEQIDSLLAEEPDGTWLIHQVEGHDYDVVFVKGGEVTRFDLENQVDQDLQILSPEGKISCHAGVVHDISPGVPLVLNESLPDVAPERIKEGVEKMIAFISDKNLFYSERVAVKKQVSLSLAYLALEGEVKLQEAAESDKSLYILPNEILRELKLSLDSRKVGKGQEAIYKVAHIQINPDGTIYLIPKHPALALGEGGYKKFRLALELGEDHQPNNLVAFGSVAISSDEDLTEVLNEKVLIDLFLKEEAREMGFDEMLPVRMELYDSRELYDSSSMPKEKESKVKMVIPYANLGDLAHENFSREEIPYVLIGMTKCVRFMHQAGIAIQDVKSENFLAHRDDSGQINIVAFDFGGATQIEGGLTTEISGSQGWFSPEKWRCLFDKLDAHDPLKADIFALGLSLHAAVDPTRENLEIYYRKAPEYFRRFVVHIEQGIDSSTIEYLLRDYQRDWDEFTPESEFEKLIKSMLNPDPLFRPDIETVSNLLPRILAGDPDVSEVLDQMIRPPTLYDYLEKISSGVSDHKEAEDLLRGVRRGFWIVRYSASEGAYVIVRKTGPDRDHVSQQILNPEGSLEKFKEDYPEDKRFRE